MSSCIGRAFQSDKADRQAIPRLLSKQITCILVKPCKECAFCSTVKMGMSRMDLQEESYSDRDQTWDRPVPSRSFRVAYGRVVPAYRTDCPQG